MSKLEQLSSDQDDSSYTFIKRTDDDNNNTHKNVVDENISKIIPYQKIVQRYYLTVVLYFVTLGILFFLTLIFPTLILTLYCKRIGLRTGDIKNGDPDYVEIIDSNQRHYVSKVGKQNLKAINQKLEKFKNKIYYKPNKPNEQEGYSIGNFKVDQSGLITTFFFKNEKYVILDGKDVQAAYLSLKTISNENVMDYDNEDKKKDLSQFNLALNLYGPNEVMVEYMNIKALLLRQFIRVFHLYCLICSLLWLIVSHYFIYAIIIILLNILASIFCIMHDYDLAKRMCDLSSNKNDEGNENFFWDNGKLDNDLKKSTYLVPGEIINIYANTSSNAHETYILDFDGIILEGYCTVDESELTGESNEVYKKALPRDNEFKKKEFNYNDKTSFLFQGTTIIKLASGKKMENKKEIKKNSKKKNSNPKSEESELLNDESENYELQKSFDYEIESRTPANQSSSDKKKEKETNEKQIDEKYKDREYIKVLVLNTGMNTNRANLLLNLSFSKKENHSFNCDLLFFSIIMFICWMVIFVLNLKYNLGNIIHLVELISVFIPPSLFVSITFSSYCVKKCLKEEKIECVDISKITVAGKANVIILDKTGTLTEDKFELYGYQFTYPSSNCIDGEVQESNILLSDIETSPKILNKIHQKYWKEYNDNECSKDSPDHPRYNIVYFTECLGACNSIDSFSGEQNLGEALDMKIFESIKWMIQNETNEKKNKTERYVMPKNLYKISEKAVFNKFSSNKKKDQNSTNQKPELIDPAQLLEAKAKSAGQKKNALPNIFSGITQRKKIEDKKDDKKDEIKSYRLEVRKIFPFSSDTQSMMVITYNTIDKTCRLYQKGAPEKILKNCNDSSPPKDIHEKIMNLAERGLRVLAFSMKKITSKEEYNDLMKEDKEDNKKHKVSGMTFLGLVAFKNPLKKDTANTIKKLYKAKFKLKISTGDTEYTSFYVAKQAGMITNDNKIRYVLECDKIDKNDKEDRDDKNTEFILSEQSNIREQPEINAPRMKKKNIIKRKENLFQSEKISKVLNRLNSQKDFTLSVSGAALNKIIEISKVKGLNEDEKALCDFVKTYGVIFFRMTPKQKADLVNFFKEENKSVVIMCGDGSNDIPAILDADIGITLNQKNNLKILSHFNMSTSSIRCIEIIVRSGRGCFENNEVTFKFLINFGAIRLVSFFLLNYTKLPLFSLYQRFYIDFFCSLIPNLLGNLTSPSMILADETIGTSLMNIKMVISTVCQLLIQIGFLIGFYYYIINNVFYKTEQGEIITYEFKSFLVDGTISVAGTVRKIIYIIF